MGGGGSPAPGGIQSVPWASGSLEVRGRRGWGRRGLWRLGSSVLPEGVTECSRGDPGKGRVDLGGGVLNLRSEPVAGQASRPRP